MITYYASNKVLQAMFGKVSNISLAQNCYLALSSTKPNVDGTNVTEPSGNGYTRKLIGNYNVSQTQAMGTPTNGEITNTAEIHFDAATGSWGDLYYACVYDAATNGNLIAAGNILDSGGTATHISPVANSVVVIKVNQLNFSVTGTALT